jgi:hypothetical protein
MRTRTLLTAASLVVLTACTKKESVDSRDVTTHGMSIELEVRNDGTKSHVEAALHVGSYQTYTYAKLTEGEQLILTDPSADKRALSFIGNNDAAKYGADVTTGAGTYLLDFIRVKGAASALANKVELPAGFTLKAPASVPRKEALTFTWDAAAGGNASMSYSLEGNCISAHAAKSIVGDPGTFTINAGEVKAFTGKEGETCRLTLTVSRSLSTKSCCSAEFGHESIARGVQARVVTFDSTP